MTKIKESEFNEMKYKIDEIHKIIIGNGKPGMFQEWTEFKGSIKVWKWVAGSSGIALIMSFISLAKDFLR